MTRYPKDSTLSNQSSCLLQRAKPANKWEMTQFHTDDYIDFLSRVTPENMEQYQKEQAKCRFDSTTYRVTID